MSSINFEFYNKLELWPQIYNLINKEHTRDMERAAAEANIALMSKMLSICREKTLKKNHSSDQLSADEKK